MKVPKKCGSYKIRNKRSGGDIKEAYYYYLTINCCWNTISSNKIDP